MGKGSNIYHVGCSTDDNYIHHASVMICSLLENNRNNNIVIHVLYDALAEMNKALLLNIASRYDTQLVFHKIDTSKLEGVKFRTVRPLSMAAYYRLLLASILESVDKVLYLDVDTVILNDISPLFDLELENYALAAVKDVVPCIDAHRMSISLPCGQDYFCSAVMLINLKYWRRNNAQEALLEFAKRDRVVFCHDQDALNYVFKNQWFCLAPKWNRFNMVYKSGKDFEDYMDRYEYYHKPHIIHFSDYKPAYKCFGIRCEKYYKYYFNLSGCPPIPSVKVPLSVRLRPLWIYWFRRFLKIIGLFDWYSYRRYYLRKIAGRV